MSELYINLAEQLIHIQNIYPAVELLCREYKVEKSDFEGNPKAIDIKTDLKDIQYEKEMAKRECLKSKDICHHYSEGYFETLAIYRKIAEALIEKNIVLFHGSAVAVDGVGYLFTAKSGTGKSTHTRLWREVFGERVVMVNDDKPLLHISEQEVIAYGTPWDGKHHLSSPISVPLKGICILKRSHAMEAGQVSKNILRNCIRKISKQEAYPMLIQESYRSSNENKVRMQLELLDRLSEMISLYELHCNMEREAAIVAYTGMQK